MAEGIFRDIMYGDVLSSDGYVADYAVCTTYSLDMTALLSVPFMLGTGCEITDETLRSPHYLLEALSRQADRFAVFCNAGSMAVPQNLRTNIYSLLEKSVVQIAPGAKGRGLANFHPKVWVIKETNPDTSECQIKVVVMSRNLTRSDDLDIVCELTGKVGKNRITGERAGKHRPLSDFLLWLRDNVRDTPAKRHIRRNMADVADCVGRVKEFDLGGTVFGDYDFYPTGFSFGGKEYDGRQTCLRAMLDHAAGTVIISVDTWTLEKFTSSHPKAKKTLITRHRSISEEMLGMMNDNVYAVKEVMTDPSEKETVVDIHEKAYFVYNSLTQYNYLYLGSANATRSAFSHNVEFVLSLRFAPYKTSYDKFRRELVHEGKDCMFERVTAVAAQDTAAEEATAEAERLIREAVLSLKKADVTPSADGRYDIKIVCTKDFPSVHIHPLYSPTMNTRLLRGAVFSGIALASLTEFYVLEAGKGDGTVRRMTKVNTPELPRDLRDKAVFKSVINTKEKFLGYVNFMLTDSPETYMAENAQPGRFPGSADKPEKGLGTGLSLFEDMMRTAARDPDRIKSIREVMEKLDEDVVPDSFRRMYFQFERAIKRIKRI